VGACRFFSVLVMAYFERRPEAFAGIVPMAGQCLLAKFKTGGGATGTIRPSTSPRMPTSGFEVRGIQRLLRPHTSIKGCYVFERRGPYAGLCCHVRRRPPALLSQLLSKEARWPPSFESTGERVVAFRRSGLGRRDRHWRGSRSRLHAAPATPRRVPSGSVK
jgi:hypothetical protein